MIIKEEFIFKTDYYVCHLTEEKNMISIIEKGLLPSNGKRCQSANDDRIGVFCFDGLHNVQNWAGVLYKENELEALKILRFNLKKRKWYIDSSNELALGFYLPYKVLPEKISYLDMTDKNGKEISIIKLFDVDFINKIDHSFSGIENGKQILVDDCSIGWQPIYEYKEKVKKIQKF